MAVAPDLADAQMRSKGKTKGTCPPRYFEGLDQPFMKDPKFFSGFRIQPHGVLTPAMMEGVEARKSKLERLDLPANGFQFFHSLFESVSGPEGIDHGNMRHPPTDLLVMFPANSLYRFPTVGRRNDNDRGGIRIITAGHEICQLAILSKHRGLGPTLKIVLEGVKFAKKRIRNLRARKSRNPCSCPPGITGFRKLLPSRRLHPLWNGQKRKVGPGNTPLFVACAIPKGTHAVRHSPCGLVSRLRKTATSATVL